MEVFIDTLMLMIKVIIITLAVIIPVVITLTVIIKVVILIQRC
jgi:hypothetical protein